MSGQIDKQYVNYLSTRLERFKWVRSNVAVCRCPFCGDGRNGRKTRFYIYQEIKHSTYLFNVNCKNCGHSESFHNFLKEFDASMFGQYRMDKFRDKYNKEPRDFFAKREPEKISTSVPVFNGGLQIELLPDTVTVASLPDGHTCKEYVRKRMIPEMFWHKLLYVEDFQKLTSDFVNPEYAKKIPNDARLVIPFYSAFGTIEMLQGRSLDAECKMRYISIKKNDAIHKVYGMERIDKSKTVYVVEGPIDSLFIDNCLAAADADLLRIKGDVYIFDCQYRNKDVCRHIDKAIDAGVKVVLFPSDIPFKDINDMVQKGGMSKEDVLTLINNNTFSGLRAKLAFTKLRRI